MTRLGTAISGDDVVVCFVEAAAAAEAEGWVVLAVVRADAARGGIVRE